MSHAKKKWKVKCDLRWLHSDEGLKRFVSGFLSTEQIQKCADFIIYVIYTLIGLHTYRSTENSQSTHESAV